MKTVIIKIKGRTVKREKKKRREGPRE